MPDDSPKDRAARGLSLQSTEDGRLEHAARGRPTATPLGRSVPSKPPSRGCPVKTRLPKCPGRDVNRNAVGPASAAKAAASNDSLPALPKDETRLYPGASVRTFSLLPLWTSRGATPVAAVWNEMQGDAVQSGAADGRLCDWRGARSRALPMRGVDFEPELRIASVHRRIRERTRHAGYAWGADSSRAAASQGPGVLSLRTRHECPGAIIDRLRTTRDSPLAAEDQGLTNCLHVASVIRYDRLDSHADGPRATQPPLRFGRESEADLNRARGGFADAAAGSDSCSPKPQPPRGAPIGGRGHPDCAVL